MSDRVAVMNNGRFEQVGTPQELYGQPSTPFVAQFVGDNNKWHGTVSQSVGDLVLISTDEGYLFRTKTHAPYADGTAVDLFLRPEAMIIEPRNTEGLNIFNVTVKNILFDGANSRLLTVTKEDHELIVTLPQNRKFDYIEPGNEISVGWHPDSGICFEAEG